MSTKLPLTIEQGTDFSKIFVIVDENGDAIPLANGYSTAGAIRRSYSHSNATFFTTSISNTNHLIISMNSATTSQIWYGRYVYDINIIDANNNVIRLVEGVVEVTPSVTSNTISTNTI